MTTPEPWAVSDTLPDKHHSTAAAVLSAGLKPLTALKDTTEVTPVKKVFESAVVVLTLVKVKILVVFSFLRQLIDDSDRMKYRKICSWK